MDINMNTTKIPQHQPVGTIPVKVDNAKQLVDSSEPAGVLAVVQAKKPEHSERDLQQAIIRLNDSAQSEQRNLHFSLDKQSGIMITKVIDTKSNEVIRQIPNEETVALAQSLVELGHEAEFKLFSSTA
jgi:flagellar protein FlaG